MQINKGRKAYDDINITPMVDVMMVLLIIFVLMASMQIQGIKVDLPKASAAQSLAQPKTIAITVTADGQIYVDAVAVTMADLEARLRNAKASNPDVPITLKGDQTAQYGKVAEVLDLCRQLDLSKIGLATGKQTGPIQTSQVDIGRRSGMRFARASAPAGRAWTRRESRGGTSFARESAAA
ncbi:MAG: biopolymer transporter ExbD [Sphingobium sp.]|nr:biopolymer transporter ExbD [Sphingobium sp.]